MEYPTLNIPVINTKPDATITIKLFFNPTVIDVSRHTSLDTVLNAWMPFDIDFNCPSPANFLPTDSIFTAAQLIGKPVGTQGLGSHFNEDSVIKIIHKIAKSFETLDINFSTSGIKENSDYARVYFTTLLYDLDMTLSRSYHKFKEHQSSPHPDSNFGSQARFCFKAIPNGLWGVQYFKTPIDYEYIGYLASSISQLFATPIGIGSGFEGAGGTAIIFARDENLVLDTLANTAIHEIGHTLYLNHWGVKSPTSFTPSTEYYPGNIGNFYGDWSTFMGSPPDIPGPRHLTQWTKGDYPNSKLFTSISEELAENTEQGDILTMEGAVTRFLKLRNIKYVDSINNYTRKNTEFGTESVQCLQAKIIGKDQMNSRAPGEFVFNGATVSWSAFETGPEDQNTIVGMIGFPYDFEISKVLLEAGEYEIKIEKYDDTMLDAKITILHPDIELNKTKYNLRGSQLNACSQRQYVYYNKEIPVEKQFYSCIGFDALNIRPICDAIPAPDVNFVNQDPPQIGDNPFVKIKVNKRTFIYILVAGAAGPGDDNKTNKNEITYYSRYGSIGKYRIKGIAKDKVSEISEPFDCYPTENSEEFVQDGGVIDAITGGTSDPPEFHKHYSTRVIQQFDTYPPDPGTSIGKTKHFLKTIENNKVLEPVFFLQEKEDFPIENPEEKDIPFTKFFPVVVNGKLYGQIDGCSNCGPEETKFVVYGKEYDPADTSGPSEDKVSFYYIKNENGETKKLEFIVYDVESPDGECAASSSRDTSRFFSYNTLIDFVN